MRRVLEALDTRITVTETGGLDISVGVPGRVDCVHQTQSGETRHSNDINITEAQFLGQRSDRLEDVLVAPGEYQEAEVDLPF